MLKRLFATALLLAVMMISLLPNSVSAAPPPPPGDSPNGCLKNGNFYPHGALVKLYTYFNRLPLYYDLYRCVDGSWVYAGSSDDIN